MTWGIDKETQERIIRMRKEGLTYSAIQRLLKLTRGQVAGTLWRAGLCKRKEKRDDKANYPRVA